MSRGRAIALGLAVALAALAPAAPSGAGEPTSDGRLLVLSLPTLAWEDVYQGDTPAIDALLDESAVAAMSVRNVIRHTTPGDGYAAMSAGARARGVPTQGSVLEVDEEIGGEPAGTVYERLTGRPAPATGLLAMAFPAVEERNEDLDFGAEIGALGEALDAAGVPRAAIANADSPQDEVVLHRTAGFAMVDLAGTVPGGAVSPALLEDAPSAPYGVQLSSSAVGDAFDTAWAKGGVVVVEGSDLARADRYLAEVGSARPGAVRRAALRTTDALVADLLDVIDPARDSVLVVAPYHQFGQVHLTVTGVRGPDIEPGLLVSASTRRTGIVTLVDIAPTILDLVDVERPSSMEGRRYERAADGASTGEARATDLADLDTAARFRDDMVTPVAGLFVLLQAALWVGAAFAMRGSDPTGRRVVAVVALTMLSYLPATYLARLIPFYDLPKGAYYLFVFAVSFGLAGLALIIGRKHPLEPLLLCLGVVFGLLTVDMLIGAPLQLNAVFGYSPTIGGRFAGMGNLAFGQYAGAAFVLCGLLLRWLSGRRDATTLAFGVLVIAVLIDGMPMWGSDVGGVLALVPAVGVTATLVFDRRLRWRTVVLWGSGAVAAVGAFALIDLSRPSDERTHLGRLIEAIGDDGFGAFESVARRKLDANFSVITSSVWTAMVPIALGFILYLLWRAPGNLRAIRSTIQESLPGLAVVGFLGFAFNDSGIAVPGVMLGVVNASLVYLTVRTLTPETLESEVPPFEPTPGGAVAPEVTAAEPTGP